MRASYQPPVAAKLIRPENSSAMLFRKTVVNRECRKSTSMILRAPRGNVGDYWIDAGEAPRSTLTATDDLSRRFVDRIAHRASVDRAAHSHLQFVHQFAVNSSP
jgi:hypothetical protein